MRSQHRTRSIVLAAGLAFVTFCSFVAADHDPAVAATITSSYESGRANVIINGYGTRAMGTFRLRDGAETRLALCIEADVGHSTVPEAYTAVEPSIDSARLDALLWWLDQHTSIDDDTAVAASALAWYYAGARRSGGPLVWADGTRGFAAITPEAPESWDALAPFSMSHPVGLTVPGTHLDAAERRVAELHRIATGLSGPWDLDVAAEAGGVTARLTVGGTPLVGRPVDIAVETAAGEALTTRTVTTDADGRVAMSVPSASEGYTATATTTAPGEHREWDGAGSVQRLATPTERTVSAAASRAPDDGHLLVRKRSADPTIGVDGAVFALIDAGGAVVATSTTDADGVARFIGIDRNAHPGPYSIVETTAPPGLIASPEPIRVDRLGTDIDDPPVVEITNQPATAALLVRKTMSVSGVGPTDRSGFEFVVRRRSDGTERRLSTGPDGAAGPVDLPLGTYDVCETTVPPWATTLIDTGCQSVAVTIDTLATTIEIAYVNEVPEPLVDTRVSDPTDGDQILELHQGVVVDRVALDHLVPGTAYRVRGELVDATSGSPTGFVGWAEFTADGRSMQVDVLVQLSEPSVGDWVMVEEVYVGEQLVARHADLLDEDQTIAIVPPLTTTTTSTTSSTSTTTSTSAPTTTSTTSVPTTVSPPTTAAPSQRPPSTLPPTGTEAVASVLRLGDVGFVLGVGLFAIAGLVPLRRDPGRDEAGR